MFVVRYAWTENPNGMFVADFLMDKVLLLYGKRGSV